MAFLVLKSCLDSLGEPRFALAYMLHLAHSVPLHVETLIFDIGPCEHLRQNELLCFVMKWHGFRILGSNMLP